MPNRISNATGLDGVTGYAGGAGLAVDDSVLGAPNRLVITAAADGDLRTSAAAVTAGETIEAFAHHPFGGGIAVRFYTAGDAAVGAPVMLTRKANPMRSPKRGIAATFAFSRGRLVVPATATKAVLALPAGLQSVDALFRPFLGDPGECWRPGSHLNPDLEIPSFPPLEPQRDGFALEPIPLRKSFAGDAGIPTSRRVAAASRRFVVVEYALDALGRDDLDSFWRANHDEFFFVRPDNGDLVIAEWADDGDPKDTGSGASRRTSIRLLTRDS